MTGDHMERGVDDVVEASNCKGARQAPASGQQNLSRAVVVAVVVAVAGMVVGAPRKSVFKTYF